MIINPIIPVWFMAIICVILLFFKRKDKCSYLRQIIIIVLLFIVNLRVMVGDKEAVNIESNVDVLFVIDDTISMLAEDYNGNERRIDAVKSDCEYIMERFAGASFSVISFGNEVEVMVPYTIDCNIILQYIDILSGQTEYYANGTSLNEVMNKLQDYLNTDREKFQIIFFISDGEVVNSDELKSFSKLSKYVDTGAVLGYGTKNGGKMKVLRYPGDENEPRYLTYYDDDFNEVKAISKIDEKNLKHIANDLGVNYIHMTEQGKVDNEIDKILSKIENKVIHNKGDIGRGYMETYYLVSIPIVIILIYECISYKRKIGATRV